MRIHINEDDDDSDADDDGDGYVECSIDSDGWDGVLSIIGGDDCSDTDGTVFVSQTYYIDTDQDGYGTLNVPMSACEQPNGYTEPVLHRARLAKKAQNLKS